MTDTPENSPDERTPRRLLQPRPPGKRVRWQTLPVRHLPAPLPHRPRLARHRRFRAERPPAPGDARPPRAPDRRRPGPDSREQSSLKGATLGATPVRTKDAPPFCSYFCSYIPSVPAIDPVGTVAIRSHTPESHPPPRGGEWGWERPASDLPIYGPETRTYVRTHSRGHGSLPARACGAIDPCGKAIPG